VSDVAHPGPSRERQPAAVEPAAPVPSAAIRGTGSLPPGPSPGAPPGGPLSPTGRRPRPVAPEETPGTLGRLLSARGWPLLVVLAVQAALCLRLLWTATAEIDEGFYITVGRLELNHLFHHAAMPEVASFMSGSPVVYPPLAALADDVGGLAAARALSLVLLLIATVLLHGVARRLLLSRAAATFAAALFGWLGTTQFIGSFATFDAMALTLLALATWAGVRAAETNGTLRYALLGAAGLCVALADAAKYAAALFDPVVLLVVALAAWRAAGRRVGLASLGTVALATALPLIIGYELAGSAFRAGVSSTTLHRPAGTDSVGAILGLTARTTGVILVLAVLGAIVLTARRPGWPTVTLGWILVAAGFLAPAEQARIHTLESLFKHVGYGAWFAAVPAGYFLAQLPALLTSLVASPGALPSARRRWALAIGAVAGCLVVLVAGTVGVPIANNQRDGWPDSRQMIADLSRVVRPSGLYLIEDPYVVTYYLHPKISFWNVVDTYVLDYHDPQTHQVLTGAAGYADAIKNGYFTGIVLDFGDTYATDQLVLQDIDRYHTYRLIYTVPFDDSYGAGAYRIWLRNP